MKYTPLTPSRISKALMLAGLVTIPVLVNAQQSAVADNVERIEVTGSKIKRSTLETASPVSVITACRKSITGNVILGRCCR